MTTLRRERRQRFEEILKEAEARPDGNYTAFDLSRLVDGWRRELAEKLADAAESRTEKLTPADYEQVNKKVDAIIGQAKESQSRIDSGTGWRGRELLPPDYLIYGDWWHEKTGLHMYGVKAKARIDTGWLKAFKELFENEVTIQSCNEALEANKWRNISNPLQIVNDAKAVQAAPAPVESKFTLEDSGWK